MSVVKILSIENGIETKKHLISLPNKKSDNPKKLTKMKESQREQILEATNITIEYIIKFYEKYYHIKNKDKELFNILKEWNRDLNIKFKINKNKTIKFFNASYCGNIDIEFFIIENKRKIENIANRIYKSTMLMDNTKYFFKELNIDIQD